MNLCLLISSANEIQVWAVSTNTSSIKWKNLVWESLLDISICFELCTFQDSSLSHKVLPHVRFCLVFFCYFIFSGTSVIQVTATDADDPTYGNSARVVYSILQGQPYFSVDSRTGISFHQGISQCKNWKKTFQAERKSSASWLWPQKHVSMAWSQHRAALWKG